MTAAPEALTAAPTPVAKRLSMGTITPFSAPWIPLAGALLVIAVYVPRFYVGLGVSFVAVALAILVVRLIDIWFDPVLGILMDRTRTPIGRFRPWVIASAPVLMVGLWRLLVTHGHPSVVDLAVWMLVSYLGYSILNLGLSAWSTHVAQSYHERSR
ncbi:MAG: MFS transporter, partial [Caulobacteraceae bacterium]